MKPPKTPENSEPGACGGPRPENAAPPALQPPAVATNKGKVVIRLRAKPRKTAAAEGDGDDELLPLATPKIVSPRQGNGRRAEAVVAVTEGAGEGHRTSKEREAHHGVTPMMAEDSHSKASDCRAPAGPSAAAVSLVPRSTAKRRCIPLGNIAAALSAATQGVAGAGVSVASMPSSSAQISASSDPLAPPVASLAAASSAIASPKDSDRPSDLTLKAILSSSGHMTELEGMVAGGGMPATSRTEGSGIKLEGEGGGGSSECWWAVLVNKPDTAGDPAGSDDAQPPETREH